MHEDGDVKAARRPRIGIALGGGSARGWAHIGVIRALEEAGVRPDLVCGTSVGALVGAAYAAGELDRFEEWVLGMGIADVISFMDLHLGAGLLKGERLMGFIRQHFKDRPIADLALPFGAVATALDNGAEVWLREGSTFEAVRASIALPGLFTPVVREDRVLVDGGLVNPVPVSLARAMGAEVVIAVDLSSDILGRRLRPDAEPEPEPEPEPALRSANEWLRRLQHNISTLISRNHPQEPERPSMVDVLAASINIMQVRIARSRMAGDPPDVVVAPRLAHLDLLDFHRAAEAIREGRHAVEISVPALQSLGVAARH